MERVSLTSKRHLLDAIWLSDVGCELGFSIGINSAFIGFFAGRRALQLAAALRSSANFSPIAGFAMLFVVALLGAVLGLLALFGLSVLAAAGEVARLVIAAVPVGLWMGGGALLLSTLLGALVLLPPEGHYYAVLRFLDEVLWFADVVTWASLSLSRLTSRVLLRSSNEALGILGHVDPGTALGAAKAAAVATLLSKEMVGKLGSLWDMFAMFFGQGGEEIGLPGLLRALSALGRLQALAGRAPASSTVPMEEVEGCADIRRFVWFALGMHGHAGLKFLGAIRYGSVGTDLDALALCASIPPSDVLLAEWRGALHVPGFAVALDSSTSSVVVAVRGSLWPEDFVTDLDCRPRACELFGQRAWAHSGMLSAAENLSSLLAPVVNKLMASSGAYKSWRLVLTGHSLGAGAAGLLAALWLGPDSPLSADVAARLTCIGYGMPAVASPRLGRALRGRVTSVVLGADVVPRFSLASSERLRDAMLRLWHEPGAVEKLLVPSGAQLGAEGAAARLDELMAGSGGGPHTNGGDGGDGDDADDEERALCPMGRVVWAPPLEDVDGDESKGAGCPDRVAVVEEPAAAFRDIPLVGRIFEPHLPQNYAARFGAGAGPVAAAVEVVGAAT